MAIVNMLQLDQCSAAIVSDEEYWLLRRRKSFFGDNLHSLLEPEVADATGLELAYGGAGNPGFHWEVIQQVRKALTQAYRAGPFPYETVDEMAEEVLRHHQAVVKRRRDDRLRFLYGFSGDELVQGWFENDGQRYDIKQEKLRSTALNLLRGKDKSPPMKSVLDNFAVVVGLDPKQGIRGFHINGAQSVLCHISGGWESIGPGKYGAGVVFGRLMNNRTLDERRGAIPREDGIIEIIEATQTAIENFHEVGGTISMVLLDGKQTGHANRYREIQDDRARLAQELVLALRWHHIDRATARDLIGRLVFGDASVDTVEKELFAAAAQPERMRLIFRGYKRDPKEMPRKPRTTKAAKAR